MRFFKEREDNSRYVQYAQRVYGLNLDEAADEFEKYANGVGVETRICQFGAKREDIGMLTDDVVRISFNEDNMLASIPPLSKNEIKKIYQLAF